MIVAAVGTLVVDVDSLFAIAEVLAVDALDVEVVETLGVAGVEI